MADQPTRAAIKTSGGAEYEALLAKERAMRASFRARHPDKVRQHRKKYPKSLKAELCRRARMRARKIGREATITNADIYWPTHCPVLGIELDYTPRGKGRVPNNPANPTLDRWDNTIKSNATWQELQAVVRYARDGLNLLRVVA